MRSSTDLRAGPSRMPGWYLLVTVAVLSVLLAGCSGSNPGGGASGDGASGDDVDLWDGKVVHDISVTFDETAYDEMIATFAETGEKTWIEADVTLDGETYERAGLRLKGNSSLMGVGASTDDGSEDDATGSPGPGGPGGFGGLGGGADAEKPASLPWLIRLDEFVSGQLHQGYADVVVRSNRTTTSLNEAVALDLLEAAELASQQAVSARFTVNGEDAVLRLAIEHPDDDAWQDRNFSEPGALYKAESSGDWSYRGDDPESYTDVFDQEGGKKVADLTPLIEFLQFLEEADDDTFVAELPDRLDVDAFATYLAMMDLVENTDDIDGPGNNSYLWWDQASGQFTVVPWDLNLAFGGLGGGFGGEGGPPEGIDPENLPEGFDPENMPEGFDPSQIPEGAGPGGRPGGGFGRSNVLVQRFKEVPEFEERYQAALTRLREELFASGTAETDLDDRTDTLTTAPDVVEETTVQEESTTLRERIDATASET